MASTAATFPESTSARRTASPGVPMSAARSNVPQHRRQPLAEIGRHAIEQKGLGALLVRALPPRL